ncbi:MAG TPA: histidine kinase [Thermoleophilaceae bacterium]|nr:histidine kinase [Thermoleophilaceae bacterium]
MARRSVALTLAAIGLALGIASVAAGQASAGWWFAGGSAFASGLELLAGLALIGAGSAASLRRPQSRFGLLLTFAGMAWFLPEWNNPGIDQSLAFTVGLALSAACPALVAHAALAYPGGRLRTGAERVVVGLFYLASLGLLGVLSALVFDPASAGCGQCPANLLLVTVDGALAEDLQRLGLRLGALSALLVVALAGWRLARGSVAERRSLAPVLVFAGVYLLAVAWDFQHSVARGFLSNDSFDFALWIAQAGSLSALAAGVSWEWVRARRTRSALAALVVELERSPAPGGLGAALARRLGDPSLELLHLLPDGSLVDGAGGGRPSPRDQEVTPLVADGRTLALVAHRPGLFDDQGLAEQVASAARLALDRERLQAELGAQLHDLRASRARIVEAGDLERRRLERDLHDGAQQRLVALSLSLGLALSERGGDDPLLELARAELLELLADLRELAHGLYPVVLAEEGLAAAVEALAEGSVVPLRLDGPLPDERLDPPAATAAYLVIRGMANDERRHWTSVAGAKKDGRLVVQVAGDGGPPADLVYLQDRVGAVGGELTAEGPSEGVTRLRAELPCA